MFGDDQKPGCVPVQPVDSPEGKRFSSLTEVPGNPVCQRVVKVSLGRMDRHSGRLVDDHQIPVLIDNVKVLADGYDVFGGGVIRQADRQQISLGQKFRGIDRKLAVCSQAQPVFCFPETDKEAAGEAAAAQIMLHAFSGVLSCNMVGKCLFHGNDCTMDKRELTSRSFHGIIEKRNGS